MLCAARLPAQNVGGLPDDRSMNPSGSALPVDYFDPALTLIWEAPSHAAQRGRSIASDGEECSGTSSMRCSDFTVLQPADEPVTNDVPPPEVFLTELEMVVDDLVATERELNRLQARKQASLNRAVQLVIDEDKRTGATGARSEVARRTVQESIAVELRVTGRTVSTWMDFASKLMYSYPATYSSLAAGDLSRDHVGIIVEEGLIIRDSGKLATYESEIIQFAQTASTRRLRTYAKRLAEQLTDDSLEERHAAAKKKRGVWIDPSADGMAWLRAYLPATEAAAIHGRISHLAWQLRNRDENEHTSSPDRSLSELRADVLGDLVLQSDPFALGVFSGSNDTPVPRIDARVQVVIPIMHLMGRSPADCPAGLDRFAGFFGPSDCQGYGPIDPKAARLLAGEASEWERVLVHPISGTVLEVDRYRPSASMRRLLGARDQHCRFPGCAAPIWRCDLDHTLDHALGGPTHIDNLGSLCRSHHTLKHHSSWDVEQRQGGNMHWRSPTGKRYVDEPVSRVMFRPIPESDHAPPTSASTSPPSHTGPDSTTHFGTPPRDAPPRSSDPPTDGRDLPF